ncbi:carbonic anhydrase [Selenomonadales bacterium OttesenSCG-928-I06]|nr:carbonic anhydrase [Selenomonadales bacterium OttesenSCG-928-I06]
MMRKTVNKSLGLILTLMMLFGICGFVAASENAETITCTEAIEKLQAGNSTYINALNNSANISSEVRVDTYKNGQHPYAVVITCSDSRVPPEHIFTAGIGELFVIRTAGNVVGDFELGSIEYGAEHCGAKVIVVLGHKNCGAVAAALDGHADGKIVNIVEEIQSCLGDTSDVVMAEDLNIRNSKNRIMESKIIKHLIAEGKIVVLEAKYDIETGKVDFLN